MKKFSTFFLTILLMAVLGYIFYRGLFKHPTDSSTNKNKIEVTASFYPLYFFASQIGGDKSNVKNITPAGAEPHDYEPTTQDIAGIEKSNLLILNGGNLETWGNKIKDNLKGINITIVVAGEKITDQQIIQDPHVWLSPPLAKQEVKVILEGFLKVDSKNKNYYSINADNLLQKLDQLDQEYKQGLSSCSKRDFVTSHAAFGYLAKAYNLNQVAISGISPDEEPSAQKLAEISDFSKKNNVKYIFFENLLSPKLSETIATEVGAQTLVLDPIEGITDNDLKTGKNYITVMKDNLINLRKALECR